MINKPRLWVIIPAYNESATVESCLDSFAKQSDKEYSLVIVDNNSSDDTAKKVASWRKQHQNITCYVVHERHQGIVWACKTGFDYAIAQGAQALARTDSDSTVGPRWVKSIRETLGENQQFMSGPLKLREDEDNGLWTKLSFWIVYEVAIKGLIRAYRFTHAGYKKRWLIAPGANMAITAGLYKEVGGFRTAESGNEDLDINNRVLRATDRVRYKRSMVVYTSGRRFNKDGGLKTLRWYVTKHKEII